MVRSHFRWLLVENGSIFEEFLTLLLRPNLIHQKSAGLDTRFVFEILTNGTVYEYCFTLSALHIVEERLTMIRSASEIVLFNREGFEIEFSESLPDRDHLIFAFQSTRNNQLFLPHSVSQNLNHFKAVFDWFDHSLTPIAPDSKYWNVDLLSQGSDSLLTQLNEILPLFDTGIDRVEIASVSLDHIYLTKELIERIREDLKYESSTLVDEFENLLIFSLNERSELQAHEIKTIHRRTDGTETRFRLGDESDGTQRLFDLLPALTDLSLPNSNRVYVIDEIDRSIHTLLTRQLLSLYLQTCNKDSRTQLIFTTHDVQLMDQRLLRRDEMWVTERNEIEGSSLISFADYKNIRKDKRIRTSYLQGRLGGIPNLIEVDEPPNAFAKDQVA